MKKFSFTLNSTLLIVGVIVIALLVNALAATVSEKYPQTKIDLTKAKVNSLSEETMDLLDSVKDSGKTINIYYLKDTNDVNVYITDTVNNYTSRCDAIHFKTIYYVKDPTFIKRYGSDAQGLSEGSIIVESTASDGRLERYRAISYADMIDYSQQSGVTGFKLEAKLTNAISYCIGTKSLKAYVTTGHGEANNTLLKNALADSNIVSEDFDLKTGAVPSDANILFVTGLQYDFTPEEITALDTYLDNGGNVQISVDIGASLPTLQSYLGEWGVTMNNDIVSEGSAAYKAGIDQDGYYFFAQALKHAVTEGFLADSLKYFVPGARSITLSDVSGISSALLLSTTKSGAVQTVSDTATLGDKVSGSYNIAYLLEKVVGDNYDKTARLIVTGCSGAWGVTNSDSYAYAAMSQPSLANRTFLLDSVSYMCGVENAAAAIETKDISVEMLTMSDLQKKIYTIALVIVLPLIILIWGLIVWLKRKNK